MAKLIRGENYELYECKVWECGTEIYRNAYGYPLKCFKCSFDYTIIDSLEREKDFIKYMKYCINCGDKIEE